MIFDLLKDSCCAFTESSILSLQKLYLWYLDLLFQTVLKLRHQNRDPLLTYLYLFVGFTDNVRHPRVQLRYLEHTVLQIFLHPCYGIVLSEEVVLKLLELRVVGILHVIQLVAKIFNGLLELHDELLFFLMLCK